MTNQSSRKDKIKYTLDILEDIMTIVVSLGAIGGTLLAYKNGFWHELRHVVNRYHERFLEEEAGHSDKDMILDLLNKIDSKTDHLISKTSDHKTIDGASSSGAVDK